MWRLPLPYHVALALADHACAAFPRPVPLPVLYCFELFFLHERYANTRSILVQNRTELALPKLPKHHDEYKEQDEKTDRAEFQQLGTVDIGEEGTGELDRRGKKAFLAPDMDYHFFRQGPDDRVAPGGIPYISPFWCGSGRHSHRALDIWCGSASGRDGHRAGNASGRQERE